MRVGFHGRCAFGVRVLERLLPGPAVPGWCLGVLLSEGVRGQSHVAPDGGSGESSRSLRAISPANPRALPAADGFVGWRWLHPGACSMQSSPQSTHLSSSHLTVWRRSMRMRRPVRCQGSADGRDPQAMWLLRSWKRQLGLPAEVRREAGHLVNRCRSLQSGVLAGPVPVCVGVSPLPCAGAIPLEPFTRCCGSWSSSLINKPRICPGHSLRGSG